MQHDVVQCIALADGLAVAADFGLQQKAVFHQIVAIQHFGDLGFQLIGTDVGEETQAAAVDAEHRNIVLGQRPGSAEQTAVTTDHDDHVADFAEHLARRGLQAVPWQHFGDGVFEDHVQVTIEQKPFQSADGIQHLGTAQATDDADIAKLLHGAPAGICVAAKTTIMGESRP
ncbi:hypothetical protein D3C81_970830 [compost metagenome]